MKCPQNRVNSINRNGKIQRESYSNTFATALEGEDIENSSIAKDMSNLVLAP